MRDWLSSLCFDHQVSHLEVMETHISWIVLTGPYAYKLKKPVDLGFVDYSSLERRRHFCYEELRLNRRLAPELYLDVVPVRAGPRIGGDGPILEYAVKMREFPQSGLLDRLAMEGRLTGSHLDQVADQVARFHLALPGAASDTNLGSPEAIQAPVLENFDQLESFGFDLSELWEWSAGAFERLRPTLAWRREAGFVRECHGDLHLQNMVEHQGKVCIFDGIEFNPNLTWIDVINEVAFLFMDLQHRGLSKLAFRFLNRYLEQTGDYAGLALLDYYQVYRALVRAKVAVLSGHREQAGPYLGLAEQSASRPGPRLLITRGVSGSGKTYHSQQILEREGWIRVRSDVERRRLYGLSREERSGSGLNGGLYSAEANWQTYGRLLKLAREILSCGYPVIVDATFLRRDQRELFRQLARELSVPFYILDLRADPTVLRERVSRRAVEPGEVSEADLAVLESQLGSYSPLDPDEWGECRDLGAQETVGVGV